MSNGDMLVLNEQLEQHMQGFDGEESEKEGSLQEQGEDTEKGRDGHHTPSPTPSTSSATCIGYRRLELAMAVMVGYLIGRGDRKWDAVTLISLARLASAFCIMLYLLVPLSWKHYSRRREQIRREKDLACRLQLNRMLETISAPSLSQSPSQDGNVAAHPCIARDVLVDFASTHVDLLRTVDCCIARLKISTGLRLGVGSFSPSVERVDLASTDHQLKPLFARRILAESVLRQVESLQRICPTSKDFAWAEPLPDVMSLSWIQVLRKQTGAYLSEVISTLLNVEQEWGPSESSLTVSIHCAEETKGYLIDVFGFGSHRFSGDQSRTTSVGRCFQRLRCQFHSASVALWECEVEADTDISSDGVLVMEWFRHFQRLLMAASVIEGELKALFVNDDDSYTPDKIPNQDQTETASERNTERAEAEILEHNNGESRNLEPETKREVEHRAIVFSGRGSKQRQSEDESSGNVPVHSSASHLLAHTVVLEELQERLSTIQAIEEFGVNGNDDDDDDNEIADHDSDQCVPMFTGATGALLSELQMVLTSG